MNTWAHKRATAWILTSCNCKWLSSNQKNRVVKQSFIVKRHRLTSSSDTRGILTEQPDPRYCASCTAPRMPSLKCLWLAIFHTIHHTSSRVTTHYYTLQRITARRLTSSHVTTSPCIVTCQHASLLIAPCHHTSLCHHIAIHCHTSSYLTSCYHMSPHVTTHQHIAICYYTLPRITSPHIA